MGPDGFKRTRSANHIVQNLHSIHLICSLKSLRPTAFLAAAQRRVLLYADQILRHAILAFHLRLKCTFVMVEIATLHTYARLNSLSPK